MWACGGQGVDFAGNTFLCLSPEGINLGGFLYFLQPPPAQSMVQALELLYALGGMPVSYYVFSDLFTNV